MGDRGLTIESLPRSRCCEKVTLELKSLGLHTMPDADSGVPFLNAPHAYCLLKGCRIVRGNCF